MLKYKTVLSHSSTVLPFSLSVAPRFCSVSFFHASQPCGCFFSPAVPAIFSTKYTHTCGNTPCGHSPVPTHTHTHWLVSMYPCDQTPGDCTHPVIRARSPIVSCCNRLLVRCPSMPMIRAATGARDTHCNTLLSLFPPTTPRPH